MMQDGGTNYSNYISYPEYTITGLNENGRTVTLTSKNGEETKLDVSFAAVLIGSRPDLTFMSNYSNLALNKSLPIDCKTNTLNIDQFTYKVEKCDNLFAIGPLAGDNFVRFIPGGALAVVSELYRQKNVLV